MDLKMLEYMLEIVEVSAGGIGRIAHAVNPAREKRTAKINFVNKNEMKSGTAYSTSPLYAIGIGPLHQLT